LLISKPLGMKYQWAKKIIIYNNDKICIAQTLKNLRWAHGSLINK